jgi:uncharacterized protein YceH (UPF0502 family)
MNLTDDAVEETLGGLQKQNLVSKIVGGRVERWRHLLYEAWHADKVELAVLAELLLRGPQTEGELRGRASRMESIDDLDALRTILRNLAERRLVIYLSPEGRRGTVVSHGFHPPEELAALPPTQEHPTPNSPSLRPAPLSPFEAIPSGQTLAAVQADLALARTEIAALRSQIAGLESIVTHLAAQMQDLRQSLGV